VAKGRGLERTVQYILKYISYPCSVSSVGMHFIPLFDNAFHCIMLGNVLLQEEINKREVSMERDDEKAGNGGTNREDYVYAHVRAKRGQATNSHSLAERVLHLLSNICNCSCSVPCSSLLYFKCSLGGRR
jgi:hypothetical protein